MIYAVNHIHKSFSITLLDINAENMMMSLDNQFQFTDLGLSRFWKEENGKVQFGLMFYRSPWAIVFGTHYASGRDNSIKLPLEDFPWDKGN